MNTKYVFITGGVVCGCKVKVHLFLSDDITADNVAEKLKEL